MPYGKEVIGKRVEMYFEEGWFKGVVSEYHFIYTDESEVVTKTKHSIDFEDGEDHLVKLEALEKKNELKWGWDDERVKKEEPASSADGEEEGVKKEEPLNGYDTDLEPDLERNSTNRKETKEDPNLARASRLKKEEASVDEETGTSSGEKQSQKRAAAASLIVNRNGTAEEKNRARAARPKKEEASMDEETGSREKKPPHKSASLKTASRMKEKHSSKRATSTSSKPVKNSRKKAKLSIVVPQNGALPSQLTPKSGIDGILRYMDKMEPGEEYLQRQRTPRGGCRKTRDKLRKLAKEDPTHPAVAHYAATKNWNPPDRQTLENLIKHLKMIINKHHPKEL